MLSLPTVIIYIFQFLTVNLVQARSEILPLPSSVRTIICLSEKAKQVHNFNPAHKCRSSHSTAIDTSNQSSREIRRAINHYEFTFSITTQVVKSTPSDGAHWTKTLNFQGTTVCQHTTAKVPCACAARELTPPHPHLYFDFHPTQVSINF